MSDRDILLNEFWPNTRDATIPQSRWRKSYPAEAAAWDTYIAALTAGQTPAIPAMTTRYGKALVAAAKLVTPDAPAPPPPPPPPPPPTSLGKLLGASSHVNWNGGVDVARMIDAKAGVMRDDCPWAWVEGQKGVYNWAIADRCIAAAKQMNRPLIVQLGYAPAWSHGGVNNDKIGPDAAHMVDYVNYVVAASRYLFDRLGPLFYGFEHWNEPNIVFLTNPANGMVADPVYYGQLMKAVWMRRDEIPASVKIIGGSTSGGGMTGITNGGVMIYPWMEKVLDTAFMIPFHEYSCHPYSFWTNATVEQMLAVRKDTGWGEVFYGCRRSPTDFTGPSVLQMFAARGVPNMRIHGTEFGAPTHSPNGTVQTAITEAEQARLLTIGISQWKSLLPNPGYLCDYTVSDTDTLGTGDRETHFGWVRLDGTKKPSFLAMQQSLIVALRGRAAATRFRPEVIRDVSARYFNATDEPVMHPGLSRLAA